MTAEEFIGPYRILRTIGKGGMGEVLLATDPFCQREIAIKRIRADLKGHEVMRNRFLREATITARLTHPGVISIYSIDPESDQIYYTMPYVEGETLRQILRRGEDSIPALLPIFRSLCQTIAYAHSKGIIHRDIKPENILVGKFGEVILLDWGLAQNLADPKEEESLDLPELSGDLTHPGKIVGTLAFMAPERALPSPATVQTDIYALGVILYQILTLRLPFERSTVKEFRKKMHLEKLPDPEEAAPYREVPPRLSRMAKKSLEPDPAERYQTVDELIHDLMSHMEGRSEWLEAAELDINSKRDWEFQENVLISKHIALTSTTEAAEWVGIMLSRASFAENMRLETKIFLKEGCAGIGFLLSVPESAERKDPFEGYCLWLGSEDAPCCQLFRNTVEVLSLPELYLKRNQWHEVRIEKRDNHIHFSLDGTERFTYLSYLPLTGTHLGILSKDARFDVEPIHVSVGSQNLQVSCLSVPDAFLVAKDYSRALAEYRRIGYSFPGHAEGREGLFRAGVTLLEQARTGRNKSEADLLYSVALDEFAKLHRTPGAPLEYLGKALVYEAMGDKDEEIKCYELALRRYGKHPLIHPLKEQIVYRMHESSQKDRRAAYQLILIALRLLPEVVGRSDSRRLFKHLTTHWETLTFIENVPDISLLGKEKLGEIQFALPLAFWLANPYTFLELHHELLEAFDPSTMGDLLFCLLELGALPLVEKLLDPRLEDTGELLKPLLIAHRQSLDYAIESFFSLKKDGIGTREFRTLAYLCEYAIRTGRAEKVHVMAKALGGAPISIEERIQLDAYRIWAYLLQSDWKKAEMIFDCYPLEMLNQETTLLHPLFGCYLQVTEGEELAMIHFSGVIETSFPRSWALLSHALTGRLGDWYPHSFLWERRQLYRLLTLYYFCAEDPAKEAEFRQMEKGEYIPTA